MSTIGSRIKMIRKTNKVNQVDFSNQIGISQATLSELEQDKYKPSVETVLAISRYYDINNEWLLLGNDNSESTEKVLSILKIDEKEGCLLSEFRKLKPSDQDEIIDFIKLKANRYLL